MSDDRDMLVKSREMVLLCKIDAAAQAIVHKTLLPAGDCHGEREVALIEAVQALEEYRAEQLYQAGGAA